MNAAEARVKSDESVPKVINLFVSMSKITINNAIKESANSGRYATKITLVLPEGIKTKAIEMLSIHYQNLGYNVEVFDVLLSTVFQLSWKE